jgi:hypothetical protein
VPGAKLPSSTGGGGYHATVAVATHLAGGGDALRMVAQAQYSDFPDSQRPGLFSVDGATGVEAYVPLALSFDARVVAVLYDPIARRVAASCASWGVYAAGTPCAWSFTAPAAPAAAGGAGTGAAVVAAAADLVQFLRQAPPSCLLVVFTHGTYANEHSAALYGALAACGGSSLLTKDQAAYDSRQYLLVGQCGAGLPKGYSASRGLEGKHLLPAMSLEIQLDPFAHFNFTLPPAPAPAPAPAASGAAGAPTLAAGAAQYTYAAALTPHVQWISRQNGTRAGGTTLRLMGRGFVPGATTVHLAGVPCALSAADVGSYRGRSLCLWPGVDCGGLGVDPSGEHLTCLTGAWDFAGDPFDREVTVHVPTGDALAAPHVRWSYVNLWSDPTTWGGLPPPVKGESVVVTLGEYIVLDVSPPELNLLTIQGTLEFARGVGDLHLNCSYIVLQYGRLIVGTEAEPFAPHRAVITLVGDRNSYELPVYGAKTLVRPHMLSALLPWPHAESPVSDPSSPLAFSSHVRLL